MNFDVAIIGSGPAGVSVAAPLIDAGMRVLIIDGGRRPEDWTYAGSIREFRRQHPTQMDVAGWFNPAEASAGSPKFRIRNLAPVFEGYHRLYGITAKDVDIVGSLAVGGLSNAWGAGVSCFSELETRSWPINRADLDESYRRVAARIGLSGVNDDAMRDVFGALEPLQPPPPLGEGPALLLRRAKRFARTLESKGFRIGRARNAVLTQDLNDRKGCDQSAFCLWGCANRAIYSARYDLDRLVQRPNVTHGAFVAERIVQTGDGFKLYGHSPTGWLSGPIAASRVVLAAGAVGSAALALRALGKTNVWRPLHSTPSAACALLLPSLIGAPTPDRDFALAQISMALNLGEWGEAFGNIFTTTGLPLGEFAQRAPLSTRGGLRLFALLSSALLVANIFLPGSVGVHRIMIDSNGAVRIEGGSKEEAHLAFAAARRKLAAIFSRLGAFLLPPSWTVNRPGADVHYASVFPMRMRPGEFESDHLGQVQPGLHIVDGAILPSLPAKAHTFTIMANADRIGRELASQWLKKNAPS